EPADPIAADGWGHGGDGRESARAQPSVALSQAQGGGRDLRGGPRRPAPLAGASLLEWRRLLGQGNSLSIGIFRAGQFLARVQALDWNETAGRAPQERIVVEAADFVIMIQAMLMTILPPTRPAAK